MVVPSFDVQEEQDVVIFFQQLEMYQKNFGERMDLFFVQVVQYRIRNETTVEYIYFIFKCRNRSVFIIFKM